MMYVRVSQYVCVLIVGFVFGKQKTAYEMRISDWSSDVCSSDLHGAALVAALPVRRFHGVGPVTTRKMQALGIETGADLRAQDLKFLERHFGRSARYYYWASRGRDERPVRANALRKSIGAEDRKSTRLNSSH